MEIIKGLETFLNQNKNIPSSLSRRDGTLYIGRLVYEYALKNNYRIQKEVQVIFDTNKRGRLDFVIYHENSIYPIELDFNFKGKSMRKLSTFLDRPEYKPIWIRWNKSSFRDERAIGIYIIDIANNNKANDSYNMWN